MWGLMCGPSEIICVTHAAPWQPGRAVPGSPGADEMGLCQQACFGGPEKTRSPRLADVSRPGDTDKTWNAAKGPWITRTRHALIFQSGRAFSFIQSYRTCSERP